MSTPGAIPQPAAIAGEVRPGAAIARNAFHLVLGQVTTTALGILLSAALGRNLGASDFGLYFLVLSMSAFANVVVEWGQNLFVVREVAREPGRAGHLLGSALALRAAGCAVASIPTYLAARAFGHDARTGAYAVAFLWTTLPLFLAQAYGTVFRARDRMGLDATVSVVNKVVALALTVPLLASGAGIPGVLVAQGLAGGAPIVVMTAAVAIQPYLDVLILSRLVPASSMGWYGAAKNIIGTLFAPAVILASACYPRLSRAASVPGEMRQEFRAALRPLMWLGALGGVGTYLFADVAVALIYGAKGFAPAGVILRVFSLGLFLMFVDVLLGHVITASGRATGFAVAKIASVLVSTGLDLLLIPFFQERTGNGGIGVIVAFASSEIVVLTGALLLMPRGTLDPAAAVDLVRALGSAGVTALVFALLPPLSPVIGIPLSIAEFAAASLALRLANRGDVEMLKQLVSSFAGRAR